MKRNHVWILLLSCLVSWPAIAQEAGQSAETEVQEIKYVTDKLRLSLYRDANGNSQTIKLLTSGDELKILESSGNYARVKTAEGQIGWVKSGFLVSEPTASFQLIEEKKKNEILAKQLEQYSDTQQLVADYENTIKLMKQDETSMSEQLESLQQQLQQSETTTQNLQQQLEANREGKISLQDIIQLARQFWYVLAGIALIFIIVGFVSGKQLVESKVKKRFQGMKVW
jgi:SH3 domain protein